MSLRLHELSDGSVAWFRAVPEAVDPFTEASVADASDREHSVIGGWIDEALGDLRALGAPPSVLHDASVLGFVATKSWKIFAERRQSRSDLHALGELLFQGGAAIGNETSDLHPPRLFEPGEVRKISESLNIVAGRARETLKEPAALAELDDLCRWLADVGARGSGMLAYWE